MKILRTIFGCALFMVCSAASNNNQATCLTNEGYFAATSEKFLDAFVSYAVDKDDEAMKKLLDAGVVIEMKKGIKVHIVNTHIFAGKVEFRLPGYLEVFWTVTEAIKC